MDPFRTDNGYCNKGFGNFERSDVDCFDCAMSESCQIEQQKMTAPKRYYTHSTSTRKGVPVGTSAARAPVKIQQQSTAAVPHDDFRPYPGESHGTRFLKNSLLNAGAAGVRAIGETIYLFLCGFKWTPPERDAAEGLHVVADAEAEDKEVV